MSRPEVFVRRILVVPGLLTLATWGLTAESAPVAADAAPAPAPSATPVAQVQPPVVLPVAATDTSAAIIATADQLAANQRYDDAIRSLEAWLKDHPSDQLARQHLLSIKVAQKENDIRLVLREQSENKGLVLADPDYEAARARASTDVQRRLAVVEYLLAQDRLSESVQATNAILRDHPQDDATLRLKYRILNTISERERKELLRSREAQHNLGVDQVLNSEVFPDQPGRVQRQVFIFQEDIDDVERAKVRAKLQEKISLNQDQAKVWDVMRTLFAVAGINYVVLDSAVGDDTVSLHLVDDTVESALNAVGRLAKVRFSYTDGTVFVSSDADDGLVTEIIRLRSGLTNVGEKVESTSFSTDSSGGAGGGAGGGGAGGNNGGGLAQQVQQALRANGQGGPGGKGGANGQGGAGGKGAAGAGAGGADAGGDSDLEKLLNRLPEIVVGWQDTHKWHLDRKSNTLYLRASPWVISETKRLLHAMDYNNVQVLIEARFVEVSEEALRQIGVDWGSFNASTGDAANATLAGAQGSPTLPSTVSGGVNPVTGNLPGGTSAGVGTILSGLVSKDGFTLNASLKALEANHQADSLAEPKILTLNNAQGVIEITKTTTYVSGVTFNSFSNSNATTNNGTVVSNSGQVPQPEFSELKEGYQLQITPSVARNSDIITLKLKPTVQKLIELTNEPISYQPSATSTTPAIFNIQKPSFATRDLQTVLHVKNGKTLALGGLSDALEDKATAGTPFISKIPVLGWLFKTEKTQNSRRNLIILVTANIVDPSGDNVGDEIAHLRDTARILLPSDPVRGMEPDAPVMITPAQPGGPAAEPPSNPSPTTRGGRR